LCVAWRYPLIDGLNGQRVISVIALSLVTYGHAFEKSRSFTALFSSTPAPKLLKPGLKSTQKSPLAFPSISGLRTNWDKLGSAHFRNVFGVWIDLDNLYEILFSILLRQPRWIFSEYKFVPSTTFAVRRWQLLRSAWPSPSDERCRPRGSNSPRLSSHWRAWPSCAHFPD